MATTCKLLCLPRVCLSTTTPSEEIETLELASEPELEELEDEECPRSS